MILLIIFFLISIILFYVSSRTLFALSIRLSLFIAFFLRCVVIFFSSNQINFDVTSYSIVGLTILQKTSVYPFLAFSRYPYFPLFIYVEALAVTIQRFGISPTYFIKILSTLFDVGIVYLVYLLSKKNLKSALLYAINPISILITSWQGQFDSIPLFFLLLAIYLFKRNRSKGSFLSLALAICIKPWPLLFTLLFIKRNRNITPIATLFLFPALTVALYSILFHTPLIDILRPILTYRTTQGFWGITQILYLLPIFKSYTAFRILRLIFFASFIIFSFYNQKKNIISEVLLDMLFVFCFTFGFAIQYFIWIIPFLIIESPKKLVRVICISALFITINYISWLLCSDAICVFPILPIVISTISIITWLLYIYIFITYARHRTM